MVTSEYRELFAAVAGSAAALTGLLFVALTVSSARSVQRPAVIEDIRAGAALVAFTNALGLSLFALVPTIDVGWPAAVFGLAGLAFTAAAVRSILTDPSTHHHRWRQVSLMVLLVATFGFEFEAGVVLIVHDGRGGAIATLAYVVVVSVLIGVFRSWELVGNRDTGLSASIAVLLGRRPPAPGGGVVEPGTPEAGPTT